jgi:hypothetical protein
MKNSLLPLSVMGQHFRLFCSLNETRQSGLFARVLSMSTWKYYKHGFINI